MRNSRRIRKEKNAAKRLEDATKFEKITSRIYQLLSPNSTVTHNDTINGRQIDISVRTKISGHDILIIINTKNQSRKVNVNQVGELYAVMDDVKAHRGVIICNKGFTDGAKKFASGRGIDLCSIHDAETKDWRKEIKIPVIIEQIVPRIDLSYEIYVDSGDTFDTESIFIISDINLKEKIKEDWNNGKISLVENHQEYKVNIDNPVIKTINNKSVAISNIKISINLLHAFSFGYFDQLPKSKALINESTGNSELIFSQNDLELDMDGFVEIEKPESAPIPIKEHIKILKAPKIGFSKQWINLKQITNSDQERETHKLPVL